jgi:hypothetical protein
MGDYQRTKNNKYFLPTAVYNKAIWEIRDYYRLRAESESILEESPDPPDGLPRGTSVGNEVESKAIKREKLKWKIEVIESNLEIIPEEYRRGVWKNIQYRTPYPKNADRTTYSRYKSQYINAIATEMELI